jgi:4-hydroxy-3-polyprenylbenzoate decarboxylase
MAFRYMPDRDTIIIPQCNTMSTDPKVGDPDKPFVCSKIGLDCTIPLVGDVDRSAYDWSSACDLGPVPKGVVPMDKDALTKDMEVLIRAAPRSWKEILEHYHGQPYRQIYQAFSTLRPRLGRRSDAPWYRYAFLDSGLAAATPSAPRLSNHDPRHQPYFTSPPRAA